MKFEHVISVGIYIKPEKIGSFGPVLLVGAQLVGIGDCRWNVGRSYGG